MIRSISPVMLIGYVLVAVLVAVLLLCMLFAVSHQIPLPHILVDSGITPSIISHSH